MREQPVDLWAQASSGLSDPPAARCAHRPGAHRSQRARSRRGGTNLVPPIAPIGLGGGIEDLRRDCVYAATLARGARGQPPVKVLGHTEQELLHPVHDITVLI